MDEIPSRRTVLRGLGAGALAGLAGCTDSLGGDSSADDEPEEDDSFDGFSEEREFTATIPDSVGLEQIAEGLEQPTDIAFVPDEDVRYIADRLGLILVHDEDGLREQPLLDYTDIVQLGGERGLVGLELHPEFADNRRLFVRYSAELREEMPEEYSHTFVLSEFEVSEDVRTLEPDSEQIVMEFAQPHENHNAGDIAFGPDGYLYITSGDGGSSNDLAPDHPDDWYDEHEGGNGQDTSEFLLGGMLRIDVDDVEEGQEYAIPDDNPLVDEEEHRDEYYAWGMRNPWRMSFDGGDIYVGDVGQAQWEWVNRVEKGGNYGWNVKEGSHCFDSDERWNVPDDCPDRTPDDVRGGEELRDPILEYPNNRNVQFDTDEYESGVAVMGGYIYRGSAIPELEGLYVFGDMQIDGRLFVGEPTEEDDDVPWSMTTLPLTDEAAELQSTLISFGEDEDGELYTLGDGGVYRVVPEN